MMSGANTADGVDLPEVVSTKNAPALSSPTRLDNGRWGSWRRSMKPEEIGLAVAPETTYNITQDNSPISIASYRTTSQLLPDKPTYSLFPPTLRHLPQAAPGDPTSAAGATLAPLSAARRAPTSVNTRQMAPQRQTSNPDPFVYKANDPRAAMYAMERRRATPAQLPRIITPQSQQIPGPWVVSPQSGLPRQIAAPWSANAFPVPVFEEAAGEPKSMSPFASPSDYPGYPSHSPSNPNASSQVNQARYAPTKRKSSGRRPPTHYTTASETSFEDDADEVDDLPRRDLALSPVVESPKKPTPKQVRYPVVPGRAIPDREREFLLESPTRRKPALRKAATDPPSYQSNGKGRALDTSQLAELPGHQANSSRVRPSGQPNSNDAIRGTAKWKILVSPGERN
ncbi:hypothetical protein MMC20_005742 [Loxospora ochrophaea]|nr:hypothetical protein [Loxospora ochrophaea]